MDYISRLLDVLTLEELKYNIWIVDRMFLNAESKEDFLFMLDTSIDKEDFLTRCRDWIG